MNCSKKITCPRFLRRGPCACTGCAYADAPAEGSGEDTDGEYEDDYGYTGSRKYTVEMRRTTIDYVRIEVAAESDETAVSRAREIIDDGRADWEFDNDEVEHVNTEEGWDD